MDTTRIIILAAAMLAVGLGVGFGYGIVVGARTARLPAPGPIEECDGGCALAALPRNRDLILRTRPRSAGARRTGEQARVEDTGPRTRVERTPRSTAP